VQLEYDNRPLAFVLDTGATNTDLYPPFASAFPELIRSATKTDSYKMEGVGGAKYVEAATLESLTFTIGGFPAVLKSVGVLLKPTTNASRFFAGNLGIDLLQQASPEQFRFQGNDSHPSIVLKRNCRNQAFSPACAVCSPFLRSMSARAIFRQQSSLSTRTEANVSDIEHRRHRFMCSNLT
jgi:hypothetical protein